MTLVRNVMSPRDQVRQRVAELMRSHWPGGEGPEGDFVPENPRARCRAVRGCEQNGFVLLECTYAE